LGPIHGRECGTPAAVEGRAVDWQYEEAMDQYMEENVTSHSSRSDKPIHMEEK
jgi:hypothetical protein